MQCTRTSVTNARTDRKCRTAAIAISLTYTTDTRDEQTAIESTHDAYCRHLLLPDNDAKSTLSDKLLSDNQIADDLSRVSTRTYCSWRILHKKELELEVHLCQEVQSSQRNRA